MLQLPAHPIAHHRAADLTPNHKTCSGTHSGACSDVSESGVTPRVGLDVGVGKG